MTSPDMHTLAGAFALNALSEHERARFQRHLAECSSCTQEVRELQATAARLGAAVAEEPPPQLRQRVLAEIRQTRQQPPATVPEPAERHRRREGVPRWALGLTAAAAVVGLALAGVFGGIAYTTRDDLNIAQEQVERVQDRYEPVAELLAAPDLRTQQGESSLGGTARVLVSESLDRMAFLASGLPEQPNRDYQLWRMTPDGTPEPAGLLREDRTDSRLVLAGDVDGTAALAVTVEPEGGSPTGLPTSTPILNLGLPV